MPIPLTPARFAKLAIPDFQFPTHLQILQRRILDLLLSKHTNRLIVEMPVRHGKSVFCSHVLPSWYLQTYPRHQIIFCTNSQESADEWGLKVLSTVQEHSPSLSGLSLDPKGQRRNFIRTSQGGIYRAMSINGRLAGKGANLVIGDDLVKDFEEAESPTARDKLFKRFNAELINRLEPDGKILLVMSRRHPDDLSGRLLSQNEELPPHLQWKTIKFPALDPDDNPLWPNRFPFSRLQEIKKQYELSGQSYLWECLFQQNPRGDSSQIEWPEDYFKNILYDELPPSLDIRLRILALDPSKGANSKTGDYSSFSDIVLDSKGNLWVHPHLHVIPTDQVEDYALGLLKTHPYQGFIVETNGFQELLAKNIVDKANRQDIKHVPLFTQHNHENKEVRIRLALTPLLAQHKLRICSRSPQHRIALNQLKEFPTAAHDDFPDSVALGIGLLNKLLHGRNPSPTTFTV